MPKKGKPLRPVRVPSVYAKRFRRLIRLNRTFKVPIHPLGVLIDLRNGCLDSLNAYLKKHRSIPDREVALELRKLLSGSAARTKFRLIIVDHPDGPPSKGGRSKSTDKTPTPKELELYAEYRAKLEAIGKKKIAREEAAKACKASVATIGRAVKKVELAELQERHWRERLARHEGVLDNLRKSSLIET